MARIPFQTFPKDLQLATAGIAPQNIARELAKFAIDSVNAEIRAGTGSPRYDKWVNGRAGADEYTVVPPGPIVYDFHWWNEIIEEAINILKRRSPVRSGRYSYSFAVMVDGVFLNQGTGKYADYSKIPIEAEVMIVNTQPYARKIEVGFMKMSVPDGVVEDGLIILRRRFGNFIDAKMRMVMLPNGYTLKGVFRRGIKPFSRTKLRRDTMAGAKMTYPAILMTMKAAT